MSVENVVKGDFEAEISTEGYDRKSPNHFHRAYEIYYLKSGEATYFVDDKVYDVKKGEFVLIRPGVIHVTRYSHECHKRLLIYFKDEFISEFLKLEPDICAAFDKVHIRLFKNREQRAADIMNHVMYEYQKENASLVLLKCLLGELLKFLGENSFEANKVSLTSDENKILEIVSYINKNYFSNITLEGLAKKFFLNPSYLSRSFKEVTGLGYKEYLTSVRLKEAVLLLKNTNLNITGICVKTGFASQNHFCKTFKKAFSTSPLKYRKYM